jgi:hypothetical protein
MLHDVIEVLAAIVLLGVVGLMAAGVWLALSLRRRWRRARARLMELGVGSVGALGVQHGYRLWLRRPGGDAQWGQLAKERAQARRAVDQAGRAVRHAEHVGAPVGDLPSVTRQLREAVRDVDAMLYAPAPDATSQADVARHLAAIAEAARHVGEAASASLHHLEPDVGSVTDAARHEALAVHEGLRARERVGYHD